MFDIFVAVLCLDYIITSDTVELALFCTDVCKQIQHLRQYFKHKQGQFFRIPPDKKICQYMSLIPELPDYTTGWKIKYRPGIICCLRQRYLG